MSVCSEVADLSSIASDGGNEKEREEADDVKARRCW